MSQDLFNSSLYVAHSNISFFSAHAWLRTDFDRVSVDPVIGIGKLFLLLINPSLPYLADIRKVLLLLVELSALSFHLFIYLFMPLCVVDLAPALCLVLFHLSFLHYDDTDTSHNVPGSRSSDYLISPSFRPPNGKGHLSFLFAACSSKVD